MIVQNKHVYEEMFDLVHDIQALDRKLYLLLNGKEVFRRKMRIKRKSAVNYVWLNQIFSIYNNNNNYIL